MPVTFVGRVIVVVESWPLVKRLPGKRRMLTGSTSALLLVESPRQGRELPFHVVIGGYGADCYVPFVPGSRYVIYGERTRFGLIDTTICDGSDTISAAHGKVQVGRLFTGPQGTPRTDAIRLIHL